MRRRMLLSNIENSDEKYLKHHWCGEDNLTNGVLRDRIGKDFNWLLQGNPMHENGMWIFQDLMTFGILSGKETKDWNLGHHFKLAFDIDVMKGRYTNWSTFLDMGSVANTDKNIGFYINNQGVCVNWKLQGK